MAYVYVRAFQPASPTVNVAVTAASANVLITRPNMGTQTVRLHNSGTNTVFVEFGKTSAVTASLTTSIPLLPNSVETFTIMNDQGYVAAIAGGSGNTLYITTGDSA